LALTGWYGSARALSIEKERELGQEFAANIKAHFPLLHDEFCQTYIETLGHLICKQLRVQPFPFHFYIIKQNELNAFAGPGGHVFFYTGLICSMDNVDELAGVLAHEMGHVAARHISKRIEQGKKLSIATMAAVLAGILVGGQAGAALSTGSVAAGIQAQLHYSRQDERQADQLGFKYASNAGFRPTGLIDALKIIQKNSWMRSNSVPPYMLTHPTGPERIANLESMAKSFIPRRNDVVEALRRDFPVFKTIVQAKSQDPDELVQLYKQELRAGKEVALAHLGLGIAYKRKSEYSLSARHLEAALKDMPVSLPIWLELGEDYQLIGENRKAIALFEKVLEKRPGDARAALLLANSYENIGEYEKAISLLKRLTFSTKATPQVYYQLGMSYGRLKKLAQAHYYFGMYFKKLGRLQKARFHFIEAKRLSKGDTALQRKIARESKGIL